MYFLYTCVLSVLCTYAQLDHTGDNCRIPTVLDAQQLLPRLHAEVARLVAGTLQQKAVLSTVHRLGLLDNAEHGLVNLVHHQRFANACHIELQREKGREGNKFQSTNLIKSHVVLKRIKCSSGGTLPAGEREGSKEKGVGLCQLCCINV